MPLLETKGAASAQSFGGIGAGASGPVTYIEDVFSTYLYTGNGSSQTINNGIDLSGKGGLVWIKNRNGTVNHQLFDTARGVGIGLQSNQAAPNSSYFFEQFQSFNSNGFTLGYNGLTNLTSSETYASWTFRKQPKFFDVVTYTGDGTSNGSRKIAHALESVPGFIVTKAITSSSENDWYAFHRSALGGGWGAGNLNLTSAVQQPLWAFGMGDFGYGTNMPPTSSEFTVSGNKTNQNGVSYVAYLFAHNAGGFGLSGSDNVISCGSYTGNGSSTGPTITLGYEPQWLMIKNATTAGYGWSIYDTMRGLDVGPGDRWLQANIADAETARSLDVGINSTGFQLLDSNNSVNASGNTYIYIAIRRGPMKVPTSGTSVFVPITYTGSGNVGTVRTTGIVTDMVWSTSPAYGGGVADYDRLRGAAKILQTFSDGQEYNQASGAAQGIGLQGFDLQDGYYAGQDLGYSTINYAQYSFVNWVFRRAPGFFDIVCYTGDGSGSPRNISHNLAAIPELIIIKNRSFAENDAWPVFGSTVGSNQWMNLWKVNGASAYSGAGIGNTATTFQVPNGGSQWNNSPYNYVAYLFATRAGVSKVGSYTGNGSSQTINCGFTGGARFVLIKRTNLTGDWYVWDTARGIIAGIDPHLKLNTTAGQTALYDSIDTDSTGFIVNELAATNINVSSATYIYLAIA